jgi:hypothetical protein
MNDGGLLFTWKRAKSVIAFHSCMGDPGREQDRLGRIARATLHFCWEQRTLFKNRDTKYYGFVLET